MLVIYMIHWQTYKPQKRIDNKQQDLMESTEMNTTQKEEAEDDYLAPL